MFSQQQPMHAARQKSVQHKSGPKRVPRDRTAHGQANVASGMRAHAQACAHWQDRSEVHGWHMGERTAREERGGSWRQCSAEEEAKKGREPPRERTMEGRAKA